MQDYEDQLLNIIREQNNPEQALLMAMKAITRALEWQSSSTQQSLFDFLQSTVEIN